MSRLQEIEFSFKNLLRLIVQNDKKIFQEIANFAHSYVFLAEKIANMTMAKLATTDARARINLYYAIDSIVKNVGGKYIGIFESRLLRHFPDDFASAKNMPKVKKEYLILFLSWEAIFSKDVLKKMLSIYFVRT